MKQLRPDDLEMASQTKIWRTWHATTPLPLKDIGKGFLDACMGHGLQSPDRIELVAADGLATLLINELSSYGVGFSVLEPRKVMKSFEANAKPIKPTGKLETEFPQSLGPVVEVCLSDLSPEQVENGWTPESLADYMRESGVNAVAVGAKQEPVAAE